MSARCRVCGCTDSDCRGCIERTGRPCHWVAADLCSACAPKSPDAQMRDGVQRAAMLACKLDTDLRTAAMDAIASGREQNSDQGREAAFVVACELRRQAEFAAAIVREMEVLDEALRPRSEREMRRRFRSTLSTALTRGWVPIMRAANDRTRVI